VNAAAEAVASRKEVKYSDLPASYSFQPIAVETMGPINESSVDFLRELRRKISSKFQEERHTAYLCQRLSDTVQRYNAAEVHFITLYLVLTTTVGAGTCCGMD